MKLPLALCVLAAAVMVGAQSDEEPRVKICEPKSVFMDDCNRCRCSDDGFDKSCTRIMCVPKPENESARRKRDAEEETCVPGTQFMMDCNECVCPSSGKKFGAACTLKACEGDEVEERSKRATFDSERCVPGSSFKIACNDCVCPSSGIRAGAACTFKACF